MNGMESPFRIETNAFVGLWHFTSHLIGASGVVPANVESLVLSGSCWVMRHDMRAAYAYTRGQLEGRLRRILIGYTVPGALEGGSTGYIAGGGGL